MDFFTLSIVGALLGGFVYIDGPKIVKEGTVKKYKTFRRINKMVATQYKNCFMIIWVSIQIIAKALWLSFLQKINNSVIKVDRHRYEVSYLINGRPYKMIVKPIRGPSPILLAVDENMNDVTDLVTPYLGVQHDFHGFKFTPQFFGRTQMTFELSNGETHIFEENDTLELE